MNVPDKFFRPPGDDTQEFPEWDGVPKVAFSWDELNLLYSFVPQWHGEVIGPKIPFTPGRARVRVDSIFHSSREDAERALRLHAMAACREEELTYHEDEWEVTHLVRVNAC